MKKRYYTIGIVIWCMSLSILYSSSLAVEDEDILYPTISKKSEAELAPLKEEEVDISNIEMSASLIGGFNTNTDFAHYDQIESIFLQKSLGISWQSQLFELCTLRGEYDVTSIDYLRFAEPDLLNNTIRVGLDTKMASLLLWSIDYVFDFVDYPHEKENKYTINEFETGLRHDLTDWLYHKVIYRFSYSHYPKRKTRNNSGRAFLGDREDRRNTLEHQLGLQLTDKTHIKTENSIYYNDSNEIFQDYYDYTVVKTKATITQVITDKLYGSANIGYQYKRFDNRAISNNVQLTQRDHLLMSGVSVFYDITPELSIGTTFDFRKNFSKEWEQRYRDYTISGGVYARF